MKNIIFEESKFDNIKELLKEYFEELDYKNDGFHNSMLTDGKPYIIKTDDEVLGFVSIGSSWDKGNMIRGLYVIPSKRRYSIEIFNKVLVEFNVEAALVASNDAHFISLSFEKMNELKTNFDMQAFNFIYGEAEREAEFGMEYFLEVESNEYELMNSITEGQWDGLFGDENFKFYKLVKDNEILGYGGMGKLNYNDRNVDLGNYTLKEHRRKGVGRSIIINLAKKALEEDMIPVAGCWYGNKESILTLKSSGFIPENRIFYVKYR